MFHLQAVTSPQLQQILTFLTKQSTNLEHYINTNLRLMIRSKTLKFSKKVNTTEIHRTIQNTSKN